MELNAQQIERLYTFCSEHYVRHYDVQVELVDHLAMAISDYTEQNPTASFENALKKIYEGFGPTGFRKIIAAKEEAIAKEHARYYWQRFRNYFSFPKILFTVFLVTTLFFINFQAKNQPGVLSTIILVGIAALFILEVRELVLQIRRQKALRKSLLSAIPVLPFWFHSGIGFMPLYFFISHVFDWMDNGFSWPEIHPLTFLVLGISLISSFLFLCASAATSRMIFEKARRTYPMAFS